MERERSMARRVEAAMTQGICRNPTCPTAANATPVERYPGPGEYCPECGELLEPVAPPQNEAPASRNEAPPSRNEAPPPRNEAAPWNGLPFGGLTPLQALQQFEAASPVVAAEPPKPSRKRFGIA